MSNSKPRILIVDDCEDTLNILRLLFESAGAEVTVANSGPLALDTAQEMRKAGKNLELIVLDIRMPAMRGPELARKLREAGFQGKVAALTATASGEGRKESQAAGIDVYLSKEVISKDLVRALIAEVR